MEFSSIETFLDEVELFPHNFMLKLSNSYEIFKSNKHFPCPTNGLLCWNIWLVQPLDEVDG